MSFKFTVQVYSCGTCMSVLEEKLSDMPSQANFISVAGLRLLTLALLAASVLVMSTSTFTSSDGSTTTFIDLIAYRYVIAIGILCFLYTLIQIPFAFYHACHEKRPFRNDFLPDLDFYCDKMVALLLATAAGAGFGVTFEFQRLLVVFIRSSSATGSFVDSSEKKDLVAFLDRGNVASALLFLGLVRMIVLTVFSSLNRGRSPNIQGYF